MTLVCVQSKFFIQIPTLEFNFTLEIPERAKPATVGWKGFKSNVQLAMKKQYIFGGLGSWGTQISKF